MGNQLGFPGAHSAGQGVSEMAIRGFPTAGGALGSGDVKPETAEAPNACQEDLADSRGRPRVL